MNIQKLNNRKKKLRNIYAAGVENFWDYYLVKWGIKRRTRLILKTSPGKTYLDIDRKDVFFNKGSIKALMRAVSTNQISVDIGNNKMTVFVSDKKVTCDRNLLAVENVQKILSFTDNFAEHDTDCFIINILEDRNILVRKHILSDAVAVKETIIDGEYSFLYRYLKDAVVLDIGAYIGDTALIFEYHGAKRIYCYEPHPQSFVLVEKNIRLNSLENKITVQNIGVGSQDDEISVAEDTIFGGGGTFGFFQCGCGRKVTVKIRSLKNILDISPEATILKMDCEGAEFDALLNTDHESLAKIKVMAIEYHNYPASIINYLKNAGYAVVFIKGSINTSLGLIFAERK